MTSTVKNTIFAAICLTVLYSCRTIKPEAPSLPDIDIPTAQQPKSEIDIPITAELKNYFKEAETSVPNKYEGSQEPCEGLRYKYFFRRSPFNINGSGNKVNLSFQGEYWIDLTYCAKCLFNNCVVPKIGASCGVGEPLRKIDIGYSSTFSVLNNYRLHSSTSLVTLNPINRCTVTILNIDATDRLIGFVRRPLNTLGAKVDEKVAGVDLKPQVQNLWNKVSTEIKLGDFGYLSVRPEALRVSSLNLNGSVLNVSVGMSAKPVITTESNQQPISQLPDLSDYTPSNGFNIYLDLLVSYDTLTKYVNKQIAGQTINIGKRKFIATNARVYGIGNQKIVIAVDFKGNRKGTIYLTGTPNYNSISHELTFPDLAFDIKTKDLLLRIAKWLFNEQITTTLRGKAKYDFTSVLNDSKQKLQNEMNRNLGDNIVSSGQVNDLNIQDIYPAKSKLLLRTLANGKLEITIQE